MNQIIYPEDVANVIQSFVNLNEGDDSTVDIILAIGAGLLDISPDSMAEWDVVHMPAADVVSVVQCKNCKFRDGSPGQPNILCGQMKDDDFCSYGERRYV